MNVILYVLVTPSTTYAFFLRNIFQNGDMPAWKKKVLGVLLLILVLCVNLVHGMIMMRSGNPFEHHSSLPPAAPMGMGT